MLTSSFYGEPVMPRSLHLLGLQRHVGDQMSRLGADDVFCEHLSSPSGLWAIEPQIHG